MNRVNLQEWIEVQERYRIITSACSIIPGLWDEIKKLAQEQANDLVMQHDSHLSNDAPLNIVYDIAKLVKMERGEFSKDVVKKIRERIPDEYKTGIRPR